MGFPGQITRGVFGWMGFDIRTGSEGEVGLSHRCLNSQGLGVKCLEEDGDMQC